MKSYLSLSLKELKAQKITAVLILIAIILSTVMTTAIGQSIGILQAMRIDQASALNGDRYATFHQLTKQQMDTLSADTRLMDVGSLMNAGYIKLGNSGLTLYLREYLENALDLYPTTGKIKEGHLPTAPGEIALPENAMQYLPDTVSIGDKITLSPQISLLNDTEKAYDYTADFTLCGILESNYSGYASGTIDAVIGEGTTAQLLPERYLLYSTDFKTKSTQQFQPIVYDLAKTLNIPETNIQYNWLLLDALGIPNDGAETANTNTGFSLMTFSCILVGLFVLLAAGLVIYNILKIAVTKRIREYGTLRALGAERGQLYPLVSLQLLFLCGIGIPIGLILGILSAKGLLIAGTGLLNPDLFMANSLSELNATISGTNNGNGLFLILSVVITLVFAMLAAFPAARYASHVSPTVAMSGKAIKIKRHGRRVKKIKHFEAYYARLNLKRGRGRTAITILSLVMSITVFVALQSFTTILDTSSAVKDMHWGDYAVTSEKIGIDPQAAAQIREQDAVESMATTKMNIYIQDDTGSIPVAVDLPLQSWESFQLAGIDDTRLSSYVSGLSPQDIEELLSGNACIAKNPIPFVYEGQAAACTTLKVNDIITVNEKPMRVAAIADSPVSINNEGFVNGVQIILSDACYTTLTGQGRYSEVYPTLKKNADAAPFETWLDNFCNTNPGSHFLSYRQSDAQLAESFEQINKLCWGLILFIGFIGLLNIINTVYSNIHTRIAEIGIQRAIGMSVHSLYKTFLWEGAYYGIIAAVIGGVLGYICTIFVNAAAAGTGTLQLTPIPLLAIAEATILSIAACLLATAVPLRFISKMNIVDSIETLE